MSSSKKTKSERIIEQDNIDKVKMQKKNKQKKKRKKQELDDAAPQDSKGKDTSKVKKENRHNFENDTQKQSSSVLINNNNNNNAVLNTNVFSPPLKPAQIDPIGQQLSRLSFTPELTPNISACELISSNLQVLTISIYQKMIMKSSLITATIHSARKQLLTPKQYIAIDYTNKLILIKQQLIQNGQVKYSQFAKMIQQEVDRVEGLILRCIDEVRVFDEVLMDLRKNNIQWQADV